MKKIIIVVALFVGVALLSSYLVRGFIKSNIKENQAICEKEKQELQVGVLENCGKYISQNIMSAVMGDGNLTVNVDGIEHKFIYQAPVGN